MQGLTALPRQPRAGRIKRSFKSVLYGRSQARVPSQPPPGAPRRLPLPRRPARAAGSRAPREKNNASISL